MRCVECGKEIEHVENAYITEDGVVCFNCKELYYKKCVQCRTLTKTHICRDCNDKIFKKDSNPYSRKPIGQFSSRYSRSRKQLKGIRYYGMELELNNINSKIPFILLNRLYQEKLLYNKTDGSISNGIEVVTSPCDYKTMKGLFKDITEGLKEYKTGYNISDNAGIHFHIGRDTISPIDLYKLNILFNFKEVYKDIKNKKAMNYICGRISKDQLTQPCEASSYCTYGDMDNGLKNARIVNESPNRYRALNLSNKDTIEFRLFQSTLDLETLNGYFDIVNKSIDYVEVTPISNISVRGFIKYLYNNSKNKVVSARCNFILDSMELPTPKIVYSLKEFWNDIKDVNWKNYRYLVEYRGYRLSLKQISSIINEEFVPFDFSMGRQEENPIMEKILNTYKACLISSIIKMRKEIEQCA